MNMRVVIISLFLFLSSHMHALVKGSETVVSVESSVTFPAGDDDNTMLGFGWFNDGFTLEDMVTTCSFNDVFPVSGTINLNGGTLRLQQDLIFRNSATLQGMGKVIGNGHEMHLSQSINQLPSNSELFEDVHIFCDSNIDLLSTITFRGNCTICGRGNILRVGLHDAEIVVDTDSVLELRDMVLCHMKDTNLRCVDDTGSVVFDNLRWIQVSSFTWGNGNLLIRGGVDLVGSSTFTYSTICTSTIDICSQFTIDDGMYFSLGRDETTLREPLLFTDETSAMVLNNCGLIITGSGAQFTKGKIVIENGITLDIAGTATDTGLILGDGDVDNDILISVLPSATIKHNSGCVVYNNYAADRVQSADTTASFVRGLNSNVRLNSDLTIQNLEIELLSQSVPAVEFASGKSIAYESASVRLPDVVYDLTCNQSESNTYLLDGNSILFMTKGILPMNVSISGSGNQLHGNGSISGAVTLLDSNADITSDLDGFIKNTITLNGSVFSLAEDIHFTNGVMFAGNGTINIGSNILSFGEQDLSLSNTLYWSGSNGMLVFNSNVSLSGTWTLSGDCEINGNGHTIDLGDSGAIYIDSNSFALFHNVELEKAANVQCVDDTSCIILDDVKWGQHDDDIVFSQGSFRFKNKTVLHGSGVFVYSTSQTSTILSSAKLVMDGGMTFSYDPAVAVKDLLEFEDSTSRFILKTSSLHSTATGMQFKTGKVYIHGACQFSSDKVIVQAHVPRLLDEGIMFGSGQTSDNCLCTLIGGATLTLSRGSIVYNNTDSSLFVIESDTTLLKIAAEARLVLDQSLQLVRGGVEFGNHATLLTKTGKSLVASIFPLGYIHRRSKP